MANIVSYITNQPIRMPEDDNKTISGTSDTTIYESHSTEGELNTVKKTTEITYSVEGELQTANGGIKKITDVTQADAAGSYNQQAEATVKTAEETIQEIYNKQNTIDNKKKFEQAANTTAKTAAKMTTGIVIYSVINGVSDKANPKGKGLPNEILSGAGAGATLGGAAGAVGGVVAVIGSYIGEGIADSTIKGIVNAANHETDPDSINAKLPSGNSISFNSSGDVEYNLQTPTVPVTKDDIISPKNERTFKAAAQAAGAVLFGAGVMAGAITLPIIFTAGAVATLAGVFEHRKEHIEKTINAAIKPNDAINEPLVGETTLTYEYDDSSSDSNESLSTNVNYESVTKTINSLELDSNGDWTIRHEDDDNSSNSNVVSSTPSNVDNDVDKSMDDVNFLLTLG